MDSRRVPALIALLGVVVAVALFLLLKDDTADEDSVTTPSATTASNSSGSGDQGENPEKNKPDKPEEPEVPVVEIKGGQPVGGVQEIEVVSGEEASFEVVTDAADELHFHGYDLYVDVTPGKPTDVNFKADIEGLFELESHTTGELLAEISVVPD